MRPTTATILAASLLTTMASAQPYSLDWYTIDGGGGTSAGGVYQISGTIGQHDAGTTLASDTFVLVGGFWAGVGGNGPCNLADFAVPFGTLDFFDVQAFLSAFASGAPSSDVNGDLMYDFFDVLAFLQAFSAGCP